MQASAYIKKHKYMPIKISLLILFFLQVSFSEHQNGKNDLCPHCAQCSCERINQEQGEYGIFVVCKKYPGSIVEELPMENITQITLNDGTLANLTAVLTSFKEKKNNLQKVYLRRNNLEEFDLNWLSGTVIELHLSRNMIRRIISTNERNSSNKCDRKRLVRFRFISIFSEHISTLSNCIPDSTNTLLISNCPLTKKGLEKVKLPSMLFSFKISIKGPDEVPPSMLQNIPAGLTIFWLSSFPLTHGRIPAFPENNMSSILIQNCNLSYIMPDNFVHCQNLTSLNLGRNKLTNIPENLPQTITRLFLYDNEIKYIRNNVWIDLTQIMYLDLSSNRIEQVPIGLPINLEVILLSKNKLEYFNPTALSDMKNLKHLDLSYNQLTNMPIGIPNTLEIYKINHNLLSHVKGPEAYKFCGKCITFHFGNNPWICNVNMIGMLLWLASDVGNKTIPDFGGTDMLYLEGKCTELPEMAFNKKWLQESAHYLKTIRKPPYTECSYTYNLLNCTDINLPHFPPQPPQGLKKVVIEGNKHLTTTPDNFFTKLTTLNVLHLSRNGLMRIPNSMPSSLIELDLSDNNISMLIENGTNLFQNLTNLKYLFLRENRIKTLYSTDMSPLVSLRYLELSGNLLICDCSLLSFLVWYRQHIKENSRGYHMLSGYARCYYPEKYRYSDIRSMDGYFNYYLQCVPNECSWDYQSPVLNCSYGVWKSRISFMPSEPEQGKQPNIPKNTFWKEIYLSGLQLREDSINLIQLDQVTKIDLSNNSLTKWPLSQLPSSVKELVLKDNEIASLPSSNDILQALPKIRIIDLRNNAIKTLSKQEVTLLPLMESIWLNGNPIVCNCSLRSFISWVQINKNNYNMSLRHELKLLTCHTPKVLKNKAIMDIHDKDFCMGFNKVILGSSAGIILFSILIVLGISMYLRKKTKEREKEEILHGFQELLQRDAFYCPNPETGVINDITYEYDAFVSCAEGSLDANFVEMLITELEVKRRYKLCLNKRDFHPGKPLSDSIVECIGASKKIILILSKNFVSSPWCQYEVQVALAELHQRRKKLLMPILIEDLSDSKNLEGCLKSFLSPLSSIRAPTNFAKKQDKFWDDVITALEEDGWK